MLLRLVVPWHELLRFIRRLRKTCNKSFLRRNLKNEEIEHNISKIYDITAGGDTGNSL